MTTHLTRSLTILTIMLFTVTACAPSSPPACGDDDVLELLNELTMIATADSLVPLAIAQMTRTSPRAWGNPDYAALKQRAANPDDTQAKAVLARIDEGLSHLKFSLEGARTDRVDERVLKSWCSIQNVVYEDGKNVGADQISYTAQYTDDDQIYVELTR